MGVVDLFACEISTLCRVVAAIDEVARLKNRIESGETATPSSHTSFSFNSAENYFPVFEGNTRDLQSLEARVVINITSFYTYMKVVRDLMRVAAQLKSELVSQPEGDSDVASNWHNAMRDVIYMLFLALEAGRSSINDLVEFQPERAERTIVVLLSEIKACLYLFEEFVSTKDTARAVRLAIRFRGYKDSIPELSDQVREELAKAEGRLNEATKIYAKKHREPRDGAPWDVPIEIAVPKLDYDTWRMAHALLQKLEALREDILNCEDRFLPQLRAQDISPVDRASLEA